MPVSADLITGNLLSPVILAFVLGMIAGLAKADLSFPSAMSKALSIYLMFAIGLKGGIAVAASPVTGTLVLTMIAGLALSFVMPFVAFAFLKLSTSFSVVDRAAVAAHYGSISIVTFVTATEVVRFAGLEAEGFMVAVAALMETPAIISGIWLASRFGSQSKPAKLLDKELSREVFLNASVVILVGSFFIGLLSTEASAVKVAPFFTDIFQGVLCLFLLDMGLVAAERLRGAKVLSAGAVAFGIVMPLAGAVLGIASGWMAGLSAGGTVLLATLAASASYIAVPAAMRLALPSANPSLSLTMSLAITFPFNVIIGIPVYLTVTRWLFGV